jgi:hypothetical protein
VKGKHLLLMVLFIGILMSSLSLVPLANAQPAYLENANLTSIFLVHYNPNNQIENKFELVNGGTAKVYDGDKLFIYYLGNTENFHENFQSAQYLYSITSIMNQIGIFENQRISDNVSIPYAGYPFTDNWSTILSGPDNQSWTVELWWENYPEDAKEFNVWVVKLFVDNWSPTPLAVEKGRTEPSSWSISFNNGGNDVMENASISVVDPVDLQISPTTQNLGDITAGGTSSTTFSVTALPLTLTTGQRDIKFQITYYDFMGISHTENMSATVNVDRLSTSIALSLDPSSVKIDNSTTITATLADGNGSPMANQEISFYIGSIAIGSENTDSFGEAAQIFVANLDAGTYAINASFAGTADYKPSSQTATLTVEPFSTTLVLDIIPSSVTLGDTVALKATLKDEKGNPLPNENVEFQINDNMIDSANTDSNGVASVQYKTSTAGTLNVKAVFAGETNYENSSTIAKLVVNTSSALEIGIVALVVIVVIVGLVFFAMKRGTKMPSMWRKEGTTLPENP